MPSAYSDINRNHLIFKLFPEKFHKYLLLGRYDRPVGSLLLMFPCWWAAALGNTSLLPLLWQLILFGVGALVLRSAGCIVNDLWDIHIDRQVERTKSRPLASGLLSVHHAFVFLGAHLMIGFFIFLSLSFFAELLCLVAVFLVALYPLMKRFFPMPQLWLGLTFNMGILIAWGNLYSQIPSTIMLLYIGAVFWTIGYDTIYAFQDIEDDEKLGLKSSAILCKKRPKFFVASCYIITSICFLIVAYAFSFSYFSMLFLVLCLTHFYWQVKNWIVSDKASCLKMFKANIGFAALVFGVFCLNFGWVNYGL